MNRVSTSALAVKGISANVGGVDFAMRPDRALEFSFALAYFDATIA